VKPPPLLGDLEERGRLGPFQERPVRRQERVEVPQWVGSHLVEPEETRLWQQNPGWRKP
jgi:hypothetical protein